MALPLRVSATVFVVFAVFGVARAMNGPLSYHPSSYGASYPNPSNPLHGMPKPENPVRPPPPGFHPSVIPNPPYPLGTPAGMPQPEVPPLQHPPPTGSPPAAAPQPPYPVGTPVMPQPEIPPVHRPPPPGFRPEVAPVPPYPVGTPTGMPQPEIPAVHHPFPYVTTTTTAAPRVLVYKIPYGGAAPPRAPPVPPRMGPSDISTHVRGAIRRQPGTTTTTTSRKLLFRTAVVAAMAAALITLFRQRPVFMEGVRMFPNLHMPQPEIPAVHHPFPYVTTTTTAAPRVLVYKIPYGGAAPPRAPPVPPRMGPSDISTHVRGAIRRQPGTTTTTTSRKLLFRTAVVAAMAAALITLFRQRPVFMEGVRMFPNLHYRFTVTTQN
uniref:p35 surface antigen n=1 Tax=Toxoplasma gondii TaxID=5811 RepID=Q9GSE9_TOXGO|nr:P35 surface antigen [Toxoplasma gondii]